MRKLRKRENDNLVWRIQAHKCYFKRLTQLMSQQYRYILLSVPVCRIIWMQYLYCSQTYNMTYHILWYWCCTELPKSIVLHREVTREIPQIFLISIYATFSMILLTWHGFVYLFIYFWLTLALCHKEKQNITEKTHGIIPYLCICLSHSPQIWKALRWSLCNTMLRKFQYFAIKSSKGFSNGNIYL